MSFYRVTGEEQLMMRLTNPEFEHSKKELDEKRQRIKQDVNEFLNQGGDIDVIPFGVSALKDKPTSQQFRI